jgi:hypothetical protein
MKEKITRYYNKDVQIYKSLDVCAGLNCSNKSISILKVKYINKTGNFCQECTEDLIQSDLAEKSVTSDINA